MATATAFTTAGGAPIAVGWALALLVGGAAGVVVTLSTTRLREDYLAIVTLGFAEVVRLLAANEIWLTRGTDGVSGIPGPFKAALGRDFNAFYLGIVLAVCAVVFFVLRRIDRSPYGRVLKAIREDAQVAQVAGKRVLRFKTEAFALSAAIAGLACAELLMIGQGDPEAEISQAMPTRGDLANGHLQG